MARERHGRRRTSSADQKLWSRSGLTLSFHRLAHCSALRVPTSAATATHRVPHLATASLRRLSSVADHLPVLMEGLGRGASLLIFSDVREGSNKRSGAVTKGWGFEVGNISELT